MNIAPLLQRLLLGSGAQADQPAEAPAPAATPPVVLNLPEQAPVPTARPTLPGGTFAPNRALPQTAPIPTPRPVVPAQAQNPIMSLLAADGLKRFLRTAGAGMANLRDTGGDPFMAFGQGFGGGQAYLDSADATAASAAAKADETAYQRRRDAANLDLRRAADARAAKSAELQDRKTAGEIERLARQNGLTVEQMLQIERIAQAAGEAEWDPEKRRAVVEAERQRLIKQFGASGQVPGDGGLSGDGLTPEGYADAPRAVEERKVGTVYRAPDGRSVKWMGNGWQVVP